MTLKAAANPPQCYPEDVLTSDSDAQIYWLAVHTKPRQEKALAWVLKHQDVGYYLPLVSQPQRNRKRLRFSLLPLFSGYLFLRASPQKKQLAWQTNRVLQIIRVTDQQLLQSQLLNIFHATSWAKVQPCEFALKGRKARVIEGPLAGVEGIIVQQKNTTRLVFQIEAIRQAIRVDIDFRHVQVL